MGCAATRTNATKASWPSVALPTPCPHKTSLAVETKAMALPKKSPGFGALRHIAEFELKVGHNALNRIFRQHQLMRPPKRRHQRKNDLRAVKAAYAPFTRFQMDVKHLTDIPFYWPQMRANGLPRFQYTIRELSCGAQFLAYSNELSKTYATLAVDRFLQHLKAHGLDTSAVILTTDLGTEFDGNANDYQLGGFHSTIQQKHQAQHRYNPPAVPMPTPMSKVSTTPSKPSSSMLRSLTPPKTSSAKSPPTSSGTTPPVKTARAVTKVPPTSSPPKSPNSPPKYSCSIPSL